MTHYKPRNDAVLLPGPERRRFVPTIWGEGPERAGEDRATHVDEVGHRHAHLARRVAVGVLGDARQAHDVEVGRQVPDDPLDAGEEQPGDLTPGEGREVGPQGVGDGEVAALVPQPHRVVGVQRDAQRG